MHTTPRLWRNWHPTGTTGSNGALSCLELVFVPGTWYCTCLRYIVHDDGIRTSVCEIYLYFEYKCTEYSDYLVLVPVLE